MLSHPRSPQSRTVSGFLGGASYSAPRYEAHRQPTEQQERRYTWQGDWGSDSLSSDDEEAFYERVEEDSLEDALLWDPVLSRLVPATSDVGWGGQKTPPTVPGLQTGGENPWSYSHYPRRGRTLSDHLHPGQRNPGGVT
ncbi:hypothetical protein DPEC_G00258990 [Dallia pectoralis]|uniref:Uncharacterized protein n=1 Tax=Dallia pectoralis TaxID=75939 RepID=A0ACC2FR86_DALPE|nr:hypothetical protein DPEC_G00258990 [Dallia pectoralis]